MYSISIYIPPRLTFRTSARNASQTSQEVEHKTTLKREKSSELLNLKVPDGEGQNLLLGGTI